MVSNTHFPSVIIEFLDTEGFSQRVSHVLLSIDILKVDVTSINDLSYKVIASQDVLGPMMRFWLLGLSYGSRAVTIQEHRTI